MSLFRRWHENQPRDQKIALLLVAMIIVYSLLYNAVGIAEGAPFSWWSIIAPLVGIGLVLTYRKKIIKPANKQKEDEHV